MKTAQIKLPRRPRGRPFPDAAARYEEELTAFCDAIKQIASTLDFKISSRGWCYVMEEHGLRKGDFDKAQTLINKCRKDGHLPRDIAAEDGARTANGLEELDHPPEEHVRLWANHTLNIMPDRYVPFSFWDDQPFYVEMLVEKIDLLGLFAPVCEEFHIGISNARGWFDINGKGDMMERFKRWEDRGMQCVLLYCGDFDPGGLQISDTLRANFEEMMGTAKWDPCDLIIDRFGLNFDFIEANNLTWIENLETASGRRLDDPRHHDHNAPYVQDYLRDVGVRKVEANALVVRPEAGRELCRQAILKYVAADAPERYEAKLAPHRDEMRRTIRSELWEMLSGGAGA